MKRVQYLSMLAALSAMSLAACGNDLPPAPDSDTDVTPVEGGACNDGVLNVGEECDGTAGLAGKQCQAGTTGTVKCSSTCRIDYSDCKAADPALAGAYDATYHYDFSALVPENFYEVSSFLDQPGDYVSQWATDAAWDVVVENFSSVSSFENVAKPLIQKIVKDAITSYIADEETQAKLKPAASAMKAMDNMIKDFTVDSDMTLTKGDNGYNVAEKWSTIGYEWTFNCDSATEDCSVVIPVDQMGLANNEDLNSNYVLVFDSAAKTASFDERNFKIAYGTILEYLYKNKVIPAITGDETSKDSTALIKYFVDSDALAESIVTSDDDEDKDSNNYTIDLTLTKVRISKSMAKTAIDAAINVGGSKLDEYVHSAVDLGKASVTTNGSFTTVDSDNNNIFEKLADGNVTGKMTVENPTDNESQGELDLAIKASAVAK